MFVFAFAFLCSRWGRIQVCNDKIFDWFVRSRRTYSSLFSIVQSPNDNGALSLFISILKTKTCSGPSCEYHREEDDVCNLTCQNDGECRAGMKDNSLISNLGKGMDAFNATHHSELFEHCVCPHDYFGIQCEHSLEICPGGDHVCLHGSQCIAQNEGGTDGDGTTHYTCNCDAAFDSLDRYAGKFCQYTSTDICTKNGQPGMGKANFAFCVNNGICNYKINDGEDPPGCNCPEGFTGEHCELLMSDDDGGMYDDDGDIDGGNADSDEPVVNKDLSPPSSSESSVPSNSSGDSSSSSNQQGGLVIGLSAAVIVIVLGMMCFILRALMYPTSADGKSSAADVQAALDEEENRSSDSFSTRTIHNNNNGIALVNSADGSLEDVDVEDYVNNNSSILTENQMSSVQIV